FVRQHYHYGCGAWQFHRIRAERGAQRIRLEPFRFYSDLVRAAFRRQPRRRPFTIAALLVLSQVANAAGFFLERAGGSRTGPT
ncbi:MAG: glycosyl transferase, partial [Planctomycetes bacterium]|nr:glycosyl transferase [Planctomycetota bacterium]